MQSRKTTGKLMATRMPKTRLPTTTGNLWWSESAKRRCLEPNRRWRRIYCIACSQPFKHGPLPSFFLGVCLFLLGFSLVYGRKGIGQASGSKRGDGRRLGSLDRSCYCFWLHERQTAMIVHPLQAEWQSLAFSSYSTFTFFPSRLLILARHIHTNHIAILL
jgi:hypothetical protein